MQDPGAAGAVPEGPADDGPERHAGRDRDEGGEAAVRQLAQAWYVLHKWTHHLQHGEMASVVFEKLKTEMTASVRENKSKTHKRLKMNAF